MHRPKAGQRQTNAAQAAQDRKEARCSKEPRNQHPAGIGRGGCGLLPLRPLVWVVVCGGCKIGRLGAWRRLQNRAFFVAWRRLRNTNPHTLSRKHQTNKHPEAHQIGTFAGWCGVPKTATKNALFCAEDRAQTLYFVPERTTTQTRQTRPRASVTEAQGQQATRGGVLVARLFAVNLAHFLFLSVVPKEFLYR